jgi:fructokinase
MRKPEASSVICWGELLWDLFPSGACLGGAPANVAFHLHAIEVCTTLITRLGKDDLGKRAEERFADEAMDTRGLQWDEQLPTGRVGIELEAGEAKYTLHPGAWQAIRCDDRAQALLSECQAFCYGTLSQESEAGLASWRAALAHLSANCIRVCDPNLRGSRIDADLVHEHLLAADVVKINDEEATLMAATYKQAALVPWLLREMDVKMVALTHAARGATIYTQEATANHRGHAELVSACTGERDNIGAGDSFTAVLIRGQLAGVPPQKIVCAANRYAAFVASQRGATPKAPADLLSELSQLLDLP